MRVALITSWPPELCGIASNSVNVVNHRAADVNYKIIEGCAWARPFTHEQILRESSDCDIVHLSYERNLHAGVPPQTFRLLRGQGKKLVLTYHNVWPGVNCDDAMLAEFDAIVVQDPNTDPKLGWHYIPQGIMQPPLYEGPPEFKLGTAGFPTFWKGSYVMAEVANALGLGFFMVAPTSRHADAMGTRNEVLRRHPKAEFIHDFLLQEQVIHELSKCAVTAWLYMAHGAQSGISGSVRLGLAAKRPIVISRCGMYRDTFAYEDEINFVMSDQPTFDNTFPVVKAALENQNKRPNRIVEDMNWTKCGQMYAEIYRSLMQ